MSDPSETDPSLLFLEIPIYSNNIIVQRSIKEIIIDGGNFFKYILVCGLDYLIHIQFSNINSKQFLMIYKQVTTLILPKRHSHMCCNKVYNRFR